MTLTPYRVWAEAENGSLIIEGFVLGEPNNPANALEIVKKLYTESPVTWHTSGEMSLYENQLRWLN